MAAGRYKDANWNVGESPTMDGAILTVLMDVRDELKELNNLLGCPNFLRIPSDLRQIRANTTKKRQGKK